MSYLLGDLKMQNEKSNIQPSIEPYSKHCLLVRWFFYSLLLLILLIAKCISGCSSSSVFVPSGPPKELHEFELDPWVPLLFWPPPKPSTTYVFPPQFFAIDKKLEDVDIRLIKLLNSANYFDRSYYAVPDGFAIVTRLEQIEPNGKPIASPAHSNLDVKSGGEFSLERYLRALFKENSGHYRIIVFIVTKHSFSQRRTISLEEANQWRDGGLNKLPRSIGQQKYSQDYTCTALIYEFEKLDSKSEALQKESSEISGQEHLQQAKIIKNLGY